MAELQLDTFRELGGVPVHWGHWGRLGRRKLASAFLEQLDHCLRQVWPLHPLGQPTGILSGGAYVPGTWKEYGRHSTGEAFDLSGLRWDDRQLVLSGDCRLESPAELACIEAHLRLHLPQCLGPWFNAAHLSHWHLDNREEADGYQQRSRSDATFLQAALTHVWGHALAIDGVVGPKTLAASAAVLESLGQPEVISDQRVWREFLRATAERLSEVVS